MHILVNEDPLPSLDGPMKERERARGAGAGGEDRTCCLYNDERSQAADRDFISFSGLKNWPTAIIAEGGGLPETACNRKPPYSSEGISFNFSVNLFIYPFAPYVYGSMTVHFGPLQEGSPCCSRKWRDGEDDERA